MILRGFFPFLLFGLTSWQSSNRCPIVVDAASIAIDWIIPNAEDTSHYEGITANVGDTVTFSWTGYHNAYKHPTNDCMITGATELGASSVADDGGEASYTFVEEDVGEVSFACEVGNHCLLGQFLTISVYANTTTTFPPTIAPSSAAPGANSYCDGKARKRRDWDLISADEKGLFLSAIEDAIDNGLYQAFLEYHSDLTSSIQSHQTCAFIHWHRRYLLAFENMLRSLDPKYKCLTVPYWNIMEHYKDQQNGLCESFGNCARVISDLGGIPTAVGAKRSYAGIEATGNLFLDVPLRRLYDDKGERGIVRADLLDVRIPDSCQYNTVLNIFKAGGSLSEFARNIQKGIHDDVHDTIGGFMPTYSSPTDPLFLVWHSFIDLILYMWEVCNIDQTQETLFDPFPESSCVYTTDLAETMFPNIDAETEMWMKDNDNNIIDDPLIGIFFQDVGLKFSEVSRVDQLGDNEFTYEHLTSELLGFLQNSDTCPEGQWYTASPTVTPITLSPTAEADQDAFNKWIGDTREALIESNPGDMQRVNSLMQFLICTLNGSKQIPSDEFRESLLNNTLRDSNCNFLLPGDDDGSGGGSNGASPTSVPCNDGNSGGPTFEGAKTITIDWFIPTEEEEDIYEGIKANVGDTVQFIWSNYHNVFMHPSRDCTDIGAIEVGASAVDGEGSYTFTENDIGYVSFACDISSHCEIGQFVTINVQGQGGSPTLAPCNQAKEIIIDWFIPTEEEEDIYDGITAYVGDSVTFVWSDYHNVFIHPTKNCFETGAIEVGASALNGEGTYTFTNDDIGYVSFACDIGSHCEIGQFVSIQVKAVEGGEDGDTSEAPTKSPAVQSPTNLTSSASIRNHDRASAFVAMTASLILALKFTLNV